jgi:hypothetical protein
MCEEDVTGNQSNYLRVIVEEKTDWPIFEPGNLVLVDRALSPKSGDYVLVFFPAKQKTAIHRYFDKNDGLRNATIIGVISELRKYF